MGLILIPTKKKSRRGTNGHVGSKIKILILLSNADQIHFSQHSPRNNDNHINKISHNRRKPSKKRNNKASTTLQTNKTTTINKLKNQKQEKMSKSIKWKSSSVDRKKSPSTRKQYNLLGEDCSNVQTCNE